MNRWTAFIFVLIIWSCELAIEKEQKSIDTYYDIDGLIEEQLLLLDSISPSLLKTAVIDGIQEKTELFPSDSVWKQELLIFKSADINKPMLVDSYLKSEESNKNASSTTYTSKTPNSTAVDTLRINFNNGVPSQVYAKLRSQNTLFKSTKRLTMNFSNFNGQSVLKDYSVVGWQKMISKDSTNFDIQARIILP